MKILYIADLRPGRTAIMRKTALEDLGQRVTAIDLYPPAAERAEGSIAYRVARKIVGPLDLAGANRAIRRTMASEKFGVLWLDKAMTITAATLRWSRQAQPGCQIIGYSLDDMYARHNQSPRFLSNLPLYDVFFTTKSYGVHELESLGCRHVVLTGNAYDPHTHRQIALTEEDHRKYDADVGFVGTFEGERAQQMAFLADHGLPVQVIGNEWHRWSESHPGVQVRHAAVYGDEYAKAICATKINLCFLRKINRDLQTTRSIEIPACGGFMLAERTDEHLALFEEGKEAEFFASDKELLDKTRYYLAHPDERQRIAAAGRERCLASGYSYHEQLKTILAKLDCTQPVAA